MPIHVTVSSQRLKMGRNDCARLPHPNRAARPNRSSSRFPGKLISLYASFRVRQYVAVLNDGFSIEPDRRRPQPVSGNMKKGSSSSRMAVVAAIEPERSRPHALRRDRLSQTIHPAKYYRRESTASILWLTASKRTGRSKRESAQYKLESEREGNPEQQKGKYDPVFNGELRRDSIAVVELGAQSVRHIHRIIEGIDGSLRVQRIFKEKAHLRTSLKMDEG